MTACRVQGSGRVELYFYGELTGAEREATERHLSDCAECRRALEELRIIREALASRPDVAAPPAGDWSGFMARLDRALHTEAAASNLADAGRIVRMQPRRYTVGVLATAALVALVTASVLMVRERGSRSDAPVADAVSVPSVVEPANTPGHAANPAFVSLSEQHFERSKLVVLGLATKDAADSTATDWAYERTLATSLLDDTRLYRQEAEERGLKTLADVMRDLELVLLQTSMSEGPDAESLAQLQRLIRRRDLITKMDVVATTGLLP
jgi:hypothetical protein